MSGRNYGIPAGYRDGSSAGNEVPMQPIESYNSTQSHQVRDYSRAPPRRPVAPYARQPGGSSNAPSTTSPPPPYESERSYTPYRAPASPPPGQQSYGVAPVGDPFGGQGRYSPPEDPFSEHHYPGPAAAPPRPGQPYTSDSHSSIASSNVGRDGYSSQPRSQRSAMAGANAIGYGYGHDQSMPGGRPYHGDGYEEYVDPQSIADDGDDGFDEPPRQRRSRFGIGGAAPGAGAGAGAAAGGGVGVLNAFGGRDPSGNYGPVGGNTNDSKAEKSAWLQGQSSGKKRLKWIVGSIIAIIVVGAIVGGVVYAVLHNNSSGSGVSRGSASDSNGLWDINSPQVQHVLNNKDLHKVFPGMDYTPLDAQYPACLANPPYQNDVTLDVAILAQLTPAIRLYGTDCNQTELVLKGIDLLGYNDTVKVWLGVWLSNNDTTNTRQLNQMYDVVDKYPASHFAGAIVGNEVLFREDMTETQLANQISTVKKNFASRGINIPVSTSDLGDDWTPGLAADSDIVMSNVHPFFAGVTPDAAPGWVWNFWQENDVVLKDSDSGNYPANIISETGWPSQGGNDCGTQTTKCPNPTAGSVASIKNMNEYMDGWVCQSMANGTTYFWFEAFDEPWKKEFDDAKTGDFWEPHWGLMDADRKLKSGLKIPDCGGKTLDKPY